MDIATERDGAASVITVSGEIDLRHSSGFRAAIEAALEDGARVLIDMQQVSYIDSSGIAAMVQGLSAARAQKLALGLVGPSESVMRILKLTKLDAVFPTYGSIEEAREA